MFKELCFKDYVVRFMFQGSMLKEVCVKEIKHLSRKYVCRKYVVRNYVITNITLRKYLLRKLTNPGLDFKVKIFRKKCPYYSKFS